jgi:rhodanese-related sulfurtransferase
MVQFMNMMSKEAPAEDAATIHDAMRRGEVVLVDVREASEHAEERIQGAHLHPLSSFNPAALPIAHDKQIVLHCGSGKRSAAAFEQCLKAGVPVRAHMDGGLAAWKRAGLPTTK